MGCVRSSMVSAVMEANKRKKTDEIVLDLSSAMPVRIHWSWTKCPRCHVRKDLYIHLSNKGSPALHPISARLVSSRVSFMQILLLRYGGSYGIIGQVINLPMDVWTQWCSSYRVNWMMVIRCSMLTQITT
ncbi:hypothetical protein TNCT_55621 [Trichonephila clavata]|uniref:Uncharacterized protein n=1 Tax=Trichonephila clavata TaxID=2740835 RepID=A0A8X6HQX3_TRICU|nr:hypothetical protein TNCT_55621 [Trichonephila clavata]